MPKDIIFQDNSVYVIENGRLMNYADHLIQEGNRDLEETLANLHAKYLPNTPPLQNLAPRDEILDYLSLSEDRTNHLRQVRRDPGSYVMPHKNKILPVASIVIFIVIVAYTFCQIRF